MSTRHWGEGIWALLGSGYHSPHLEDSQYKIHICTSLAVQANYTMYVNEAPQIVSVATLCEELPASQSHVWSHVEVHV